MKTITIQNFDGGMAEDIYGGGQGEFSIAKHFDILTYPNRLYPYRGMSSDTAGTGIGKIIVGTDGNFYGVGTVSGFPTVGALYTRSSGAWVEGIGNLGDTVNYNLLVEYHNSSGARKFIYAGNNQLGIFDTALASGAAEALTFTNICQGFVHPKDDVLYIGYDNKIATNNNGTWTKPALTLPANYRVTSLTNYGNYLAIACCPSNGGVDKPGNSVVYLWDRNSAFTTLSEVVDWGSGSLQVINNLDGVLIGISDTGAATATTLDFDSIQIKAYTGGSPQLIKEIPTIKQTTTTPDAVINPRVNFIYRGKLYFSINIQSGSTSPSYYGLWTIGKSKRTGRYAVTMERVATTGNTETGVLAAAISGDVASICHTAAGTLTYTNTGSSIGDQWTATSLFESLVNPEMPAMDKVRQKQLAAVAVHYLPLTSAGQVVAKYRVDGGSWTTIFTETTDGVVVTERTMDAAGTQFTAGRNYEFRIESTGNAHITGFTYKYDTLPTTI